MKAIASSLLHGLNWSACSSLDLPFLKSGVTSAWLQSSESSHRGCRRACLSETCWFPWRPRDLSVWSRGFVCPICFASFTIHFNTNTIFLNVASQDSGGRPGSNLCKLKQSKDIRYLILFLSSIINFSGPFSNGPTLSVSFFSKITTGSCCLLHLLPSDLWLS